MPFEIKENSGQLFKNQYKKEDKHPDYRGELKIEGELWDMSAWIKKSAKGDSYMSMSFRRQSERPQKQDDAPKQAPPADDLIDDDVPF